MVTRDRQQVKHRTIGRRKEDFDVRDKVVRDRRLFRVIQILTSQINMDVLVELIMEQTNDILGTERSTVFLHDQNSGQLWSLVATGLKRKEIRIPADCGVAGWVFLSKEPVIINDAYGDPRFFDGIDRRTGFRTRNLLCVPLINREKECIGALEALNKKSGDFDEGDIELLTPVSHYVTIALENARLYDDLKSLDRAKEKVLHHLSHELRTPLSIISSVLHLITGKSARGDTAGIERMAKMGFRNIDRLLKLQAKIDDVFLGRTSEHKKDMLSIVEDALWFVEQAKEANPGDHARVLGLVSERIEAMYGVDKVRMETITLHRFLDKVCDDTVEAMGGRDVDIVRDFDQKAVVIMDRNVLAKVCEGLLKNAIENSPDGGKVEVAAFQRNSEVVIEYRDFGTGITVANQNLIFGGFFHTQDTEDYASRDPYAFNAGGSGIDLLRTKVFSERYGFKVSFTTRRCRYVPDEKDICPGRIALCPHIRSAEECFRSGGTTFSLRFPFP